MLIVPPSMSNTERQRRFRERNPGYYGRLHRKRAAASQQTAVISAHAGQPLMLPAPVEQDLLLQQLAASIAGNQAELVPVKSAA